MNQLSISQNSTYFLFWDRKKNHGIRSKSISVVIKDIPKVSTMFDIFGPVYCLVIAKSRFLVKVCTL